MVSKMSDIDERISALISNLEAAQKTIDPQAPHYMLLLQVRALAEIVKSMAAAPSPS